MKRIRTVFTTTASGAPLALQDLYNVENTHVRQISFAHSNTINPSILLWKDKDILPAPPFAVGIWYQQSHELIPVGVITEVPEQAISLGEFEKLQSKTFVTLSELTGYIINRIASFDMPTVRYNNAKEERLARAAMWAMCDPNNHHVLNELEVKKESKFNLGEVPVNKYPQGVQLPEELKPFCDWFNAWLDAQ
jgi:hypothetical protein